MSKERELSLKVLWIYNCNEAEIALAFQLEEDGIDYQVKGNGPGAFDSNDNLRVCQADNLEDIRYLSPDTKVFIKESDKIQRIWDYWEKESGITRYETVLNQLNKFREEQNQILFEQAKAEKGFLEGNNVELSKKQIFDLVFEIDAIIAMLKAIKGGIDKKQVSDLIENATAGFSEKSVQAVLEELKRKKIIE